MYCWNYSSCASYTSLQWAGSTLACSWRWRKGQVRGPVQNLKGSLDISSRSFFLIASHPFLYPKRQNRSPCKMCQMPQDACVCGKTSAEFCKLLHLETVCRDEMGEGWKSSWSGSPAKQVTMHNHWIASRFPKKQKHFQARWRWQQDQQLKYILQT